MKLDRSPRAFGNHAIANDGILMALYDLGRGPGTQHVETVLLSSPDHRGATGPMLVGTSLTIEYVGETDLQVIAGNFRARHFRIVGVPGMPEAHPVYELWVTADDDYVLLKAEVGGYMQTTYELTDYRLLAH